VFGGVITSTLLTLIVIPTIYEILDELKEWASAKFRGKKPAPAGARAPELAAGD
jgi:hypothetical protein